MMPEPAAILSRFLETVQRLLFPTAVIIAIGAFAFLLFGRIQLINSWSHDMGGIEQNVVYGIQRIIDGQSLYTDPNQPPYAVMMYSPLYFHAVAIVGKITGANPDNPMAIYHINRSVALIFNLLFIGLLGLIAVRHFNIPGLAAIIIGSLVFSYLRITDFGRPDSLYHLSILVTLASGLEFLRSRKALFGILAVIMSAVCLFAKQSGLIVPVILFFYLLIYERKNALLGLPIFLASFGLLWLLLSGNSYSFWQNVYQGVNNGISWDWFKRRILFFYLREIALFSGLVLLLAVLFITKFSKSVHHLLGVALFGMFFFALLTALKWGSMPSYFTPFITLGWIGIASYLYSDHIQLTTGMRNALLGGLAICCFVTEVPHKYNTFHFQSSNKRYLQAKQVTDYLKNDLQLQPNERVLTVVNGQHLIEQHFLNNFLFRNALLPTKDITTCCAYPLKKFDYTQLNQEIETGMVKYLIRSKGDNHKKFFSWEFKTFQKIKELDGYSVWTLPQE